VRSLTRDEAVSRAALLTVDAMRVDLDLDRGPDVFGSRSEIRFTCHAPGSSTFAEVRPRELRSARLNGRPLDPATLSDGRLPLTDLAVHNVLEVEASMGYGHDGQGLHRSTDPADDEDYVYGHLFLDAAPRVFACFDQPDLKAPYTVAVTAPRHWVVIGNGAASQVSAGRWELSRTPPLATYFVTVCAGPYVSVTDEHDGVPLGVHARASLEPYLREQAPRMLATTRTCLDHYHRLFGIRYPFQEYHQVFVPEFNAGAMENPGCVTFRDTYVFRGAATPDQLFERDNTIAHEMAHMWFGDLVTMRWWDDLWLNESFAEYMAYRASAEALGDDSAWVEFGILRKLWGYAAERSPSTHPVAGSPAPDAISALQNFDGISYAKGASVLRQLIAHLGDDAFVAGVTAYLRSHANGNGELAEFLDAMAGAAGRPLDQWAQGWLRTAGADRLELTRTGELTRATPAEHPAERPHRLDVAAFSGGVEVLHEVVDLDGPSATVPGVAELPADAVLVPNAGDLTWAQVVLDRTTLAALPHSLADVPSPVARSVVWTSLLGSVATAEVDPRDLLEVVDRAWSDDLRGDPPLPPARGAGGRARAGGGRGRPAGQPGGSRGGPRGRGPRRGRGQGVDAVRRGRGEARAVGRRERRPRRARRRRGLPLARAAQDGGPRGARRGRDRGGRGTGPVAGGTARRAGSHGGPPHAGGEGLGLDPARRGRAALQLRGPADRGQLLERLRPLGRASVRRPGGRPARGPRPADGRGCAVPRRHCPAPEGARRGGDPRRVRGAGRTRGPLAGSAPGSRRPGPRPARGARQPATLRPALTVCLGARPGMR
jgi:hypothetical protein